jgi:hypothetical protein
MTGAVLFSDDSLPFDWSEAEVNEIYYGPKGARLAALPRQWTLPFALVPASVFGNARTGLELKGLGNSFVARINSLTEEMGKLIVRSSIIGESIWDRGTYESVVIASNAENFLDELVRACSVVLQSATDREVALVIQRYIQPRSRGEFGNLLRISKTRDHWELSTESADGATSRIRFNTQRDEAASPTRSLEIRPRLAAERLFGSIGAWLNNNLMRAGHGG